MGFSVDEVLGMYSKLAFVFPGQGSQYVTMLEEFAARFPLLKATYAEASEVLGYDLWQLVQQGPEARLNQTEYTQPALLVGEVALWKIWLDLSAIKPLFMAGHSLGEYTALVCAEALDFIDAVKLVAERGRLMQQAVASGQGGMVAVIGLDEAEIKVVCSKAAQGEILAAANFNAIGQTVLSGNMAAAERAVDLAKAAGAKIARLLEVSVPSHCELMRPAAEQLAQELDKININAPKIPVLNNVDAEFYRDTKSIRDSLIRQLYSPVRWVETIQTLHKKGLDCLVECGPGKVLAGLNKRIVKDLPTISFAQLLGELS